MRVALIFPPYKHKIFSENLSTVDEEFCLAPPIILAYVAAILEQYGHKVMLLDARTLNLSKEKALEQLRSFMPDILGFRAESYHFHDALDWVKYLKAKLAIPVIAGGVNLSLYPQEVMHYREIDYGICGEAIKPLPQLLAALEYGDDFRQIPGVVYRNEEEEVIINPPDQRLVPFDAYPFPARHLLPNNKYYSFISQRKNFTIMLTSTGCPFGCTFCAIPNAYRVRTPENVIDEIEVCYRDFGVREIDFFDAVLFMPKPRILEIFNLMKKRKFDIEWSARSRVDMIDEEILKEASATGCRQIYYGIESAEQDILDAINKRIEPEKVREVIKLSRNYGIRAMGFFMVGNPGETKESVRKTIEFAKDLGLDFIQVCRTIAKPGTQLDKTMIEVTSRDYWREHIRGNKIKGRLPVPWSDLTESEMESLTKEFYKHFYFRPKIIFSRVFQLRSLNELLRYVRVGWKMLIQKSEIYSHILTDTSEAEEFLAKSKIYLSEARSVKATVVIPTHNEKENIQKIVYAIDDILPNANIVVVDDNSPDGTSTIAEELSRHKKNIYLLCRKGKRGLGLAYIDGFKFALHNLDPEFIFEMDADYSHDPRYLPIFIHYAQNYDLVTGSRFLRRVSIKNRTLWRNIISKIGKWIVNKAIGMELTDITTGFKCFRRATLEKIDFTKVKSTGFAFQIEVSYRLNKMKADIKEIPIMFVERTAGNSKMSVSILLEGIYLVLKLSIERFKLNKLIHK